MRSTDMTQRAARARRAKHAVGWGLAYFALAVMPLPLALVRSQAGGRGFWVELGVGLGFAGLSMMGLQFALTARFHWIGRGLGLDEMMHVHRQAGILAAAYVVAHPVVLIVAEPAFVAFFDPRVNFLRALALWGALGCIAVLVGASLLRRRLGIPYEWWRVTHALFAFFVLFIGITHIMMVGHYVSEVWRRALWIAMTGAAMALLLHTRFVRPVQVRRRPWRLADVRRERERVWTLVLEAQNHDGMRFMPGQFAWVSLDASPRSLQQHPFTIASSAEEPRRVEVTIKELGDFTSTVGQRAPGAPAYLEGPYGNFSIDAVEGATAAVFLCGGIGVTPAMSMLRTLRDRGDTRPLTLVYGNATLDKAAFREELDRLAEGLDLRVLHVPEEPPPGWQGESGYITPDLLARHVDLQAPGVHYFICGPDVMMDALEPALLQAGVPPTHIHAERFNMV